MAARADSFGVRFEELCENVILPTLERVIIRAWKDFSPAPMRIESRQGGGSCPAAAE